MNEKEYHNQLDDYILGRLTPAERAEFETHLKGCPSCSGELKKLGDLQAKIDKLPRGIAPRRDLWEGISEELADSQGGHAAALPEPAEQARDKQAREKRARRADPDSGSVRTPLSGNWHVRAAALFLILLTGAGVWMKLRDSRPPEETALLSLPSEHTAKTPGDVPKSGVIESGEASHAAAKPENGSHEAIESTPSKAQNGGEKAISPTVPAIADAKGEPTQGERTAEEDIKSIDQTTAAVEQPPDGVVQHLLASFTNYTSALPNDRVYLQFDRPFYRPGETIWFKGYVRNEDDLSPSSRSDVLHVELINPKGAVAQQLTLLAPDGNASGDIGLDSQLPGGLYKVRAYTQWQKNFHDPFLFEKEIQVQNVVLSHLKMKLEFERKAFGGGDHVIAKLEASTLDNKPLSNFEFRYVAQLAGTPFADLTGTTDRDGKAYVGFNLPGDLSSTDGLLAVLLGYEGQTESISRSIPIVLNRIHFTMYPEGGDLVEGLRANVAFQALNEFDKPADVEGIVLDETGKEVTRFSSFHQGMGAFALTPGPGRRYRAIITKPEGIAESFNLPAPLGSGFTLAVVREAPGRINLVVGSDKDEAFSIVAQMRGRLCFSKRFEGHSGTVTIPFRTDDLPAGVLQATLFDGKGVGQAERLVFVNKDKVLKLAVTTDKEKYLPREKVTLTIRAEVNQGTAPGGAFSLAVADDKLISFADDKAGNILAKMLLEPDLKGKIEEPNFYFDPAEPKSDEALDFLMMTRGWRRFTWKQVLADTAPVITYAAERARIGGTVVDRTDGRPVENALVTIRNTADTVRTDRSGRFAFKRIRLENLPVVEVLKDGFMAYQTPLTDYTEDLRCELWKPGSLKTIAGRVIDKNTKEPLAFVNVMVSSTNRGASTDREGKFAILGLPPGTYRLQASMLGYNRVEIQNVQVPAITPEINIEMASTGVEMNEQVVTAQKLVNEAMTNAVQMETRAVTAAQDVVIAKGTPKAPPLNGGEDLQKLQGGAVKQGNNLYLRGGRANEVQYLVDGVAGDKVQRDGKLRHLKAARREAGYIAEAPPQQAVRKFYRAREFPAPVYASGQTPDVRNDFRSTIFWKNDITLDGTGKAIVTFYNSDEVTSFRATVEGIGGSGLVGRAEKTYYTQLPFSLSAKAPEEVSMGDKVSVPITLANHTGESVAGELSVISPESWHRIGPAGGTESIPPGASKTIFIPFEILNRPGTGTIEIAFTSGGLRDAFSQDVRVTEMGFPQVLSLSSSEKEKSYSVNVGHPIAGTVQAKVTAFPTVGSNLLSAVDAMLREPSGCFEQSSSTNYPNVIALRYLKEAGVQDASLTARAEKLLDDGYKRLVTFETKDKGYEWFGSTPPNEALTAYGLMEFSDMEPVYASVDKSMVERTSHWLMSRRDGKGGFLIDPKAVDSFGRASAEITAAYIVYALTEAGRTDIGPELAAACASALATHDPYQLALVANAALGVNDRERASKVFPELLKAQQEDGSWCGSSHSITRSTGASLKIETTALALLAMLKSGSPDPGALTNGVKFLLSSRSGYGGFGSTQGTILALKALTGYAKYSKRTAEAGAMEVRLDGKKIAGRPYEAGEEGPIVIDSLGKYLLAGGERHSLTVAMSGAKHPLPYSVLVSWNTSLPNSSDSAKVSLGTKIAQPAVRMGETVRFTAVVANRTSEGLPMTIAVVGLPGGLSAQPWQLKELQEKGRFDFYEIKGRNIAFYFRQMKPDERKEIGLDLKAEIPGRYESPASSAYLYYTNEFKSWSSAGPIEVREQ